MFGDSSSNGVFGDQAAVPASMTDRIVRHADVLTLKGGGLPTPRTRHRQPPQHTHHRRRTRVLTADNRPLSGAGVA